MSRPNKPATTNRTRRNAGQSSGAGAIQGVYVIDKPMGITSMTAVEIIRRKAGGTKTGHAGTLDPRATGVLVLALGSATKLINQLMATDKKYRTTIDLTAFTTTDDLEGEKTLVQVESPPTQARVQAALQQFVGTIMQRPPAFSAMKVNGKRAYKMARQGEAVEIPARQVVIHSIELLEYQWPHVTLEMHCEKGVYVRSLARDLGEALATGGHCTSIHRSAVGPFTEAMAVPLDEATEPLVQEHLLTSEQALAMIAR